MRTLAALIAAFALAAGSRAAEPPGPASIPVPFRVPPGWTAQLYASEPQLANPVAIALDEKDRVYVAEEYRFNRGTEENRTRPFFLEDDLQIQTLDDRLAMYRKHAGRFEGGMSWFTKHADQVRRLEDRDGDGRADRSTVFAGGFNGVLDGLAAGLIARDGNVYLTCIPNLWRLADRDDDGVAEVREVVHRGFGVNAAFLGHDLHGLAWGPDGKLYFSVGDRGFHLTPSDGPVLHGPRTGAVFRCDPDGKNLEVVARGLRNPQELAFDNHGRLFAVDNNCDKGDHSRLVFVIEGGDSGWNMAYQSLPEPYLTGPWHAEQMWHLPEEAQGQPAWIVPPVGKLGAGPSGFVTAPGIGLPERYRDHFFYCNFTGNGGVESFAVEPHGAGFRMVDLHPVVTPVMATDVDFGHDGAMYLSEFGQLAWDGSNKEGRVYRVVDPASAADPVVAQVRSLFREGFAKRSTDSLLGLLGHPDRRVRQRAQFALADRGESAVAGLSNVVRNSSERSTRLHALWALGQIARRDPRACEPLVALLDDHDAAIRAQGAWVLGQVRHASAVARLCARLVDPDPAVQLQSALALGRLSQPESVEPLIGMLRENADRDPYLRHAGVMGLLGSKAMEAVAAHAGDPSPSVRLAVLLVERRMADPRVAEFLDDADPRLAAEAARAINDVPIEAAMPRLADRLGRLRSDDAAPLVRRAIHAAYRRGSTRDAELVARLAADGRQPAPLRDEALQALGDWSSPPHRDRVNGFWRPLSPRDPGLVRAAVSQAFANLISTGDGPFRARVIDLATRTGAEVGATPLADWLTDAGQPSEVRLASLRWLVTRKDPRLDTALDRVASGSDPTLRAEARDALVAIDPARALRSIAATLANADAPVAERQRAIASASKVKGTEADALFRGWVERLDRDEVAPEIRLDLAEAAASRHSRELDPILRRRVEKRAGQDPLASFRDSLLGGDPQEGRSLFVNNPQAQCIRCHRVGDRGGSAGPELSDVASRGDREYLLRSLVEPDAAIAEGFGTVQLALRDGRILAGLIRSESGGRITIVSPTGLAQSVAAEDVEERSAPRSAMPRMTEVLTPRQLRDLVAYLATLRAPGAKGKAAAP